MTQENKTVVNENRYKPRPGQKIKKLEVEFITDDFMGAWHEPEDLMRWIASHNYVQKVSLK